MDPLLFTPPASGFEPAFWETLYHKKLNVYRLNADPVSIIASVTNSDGKEGGQVKFSDKSFSSEAWARAQSISGRLINVNKIEEFTGYDKKEVLKEAGLNILEGMVKGHAIRSPALLNQFTLLSFADLKTYKFVYWYAQPALSLTNTITGSVQRLQSESPPLTAEVLQTSYTFLARLVRDGQVVPPVFVVRDTRHRSSEQFMGEDASTRPVPALGFEQKVASDTSAADCSDANSSANDDGEPGLQAMTLFDAWPYRYDPNITFITLDDAAHPQALSWSTRNLLTLLALYSSLDRSAYFVSSLFVSDNLAHQEQQQEQLQQTDRKHVRLLALRNPLLKKLLQQHAHSSAASAAPPATWDIAKLVAQDASAHASISLPMFSLPDSIDQGGEVNLSALHTALCPTTVGWEPNERGKAGPRVVDMKATLDARLLMSQAVDLNLRLMKWRMWPTLQVDVLAQQRCLLLGSGTLGCAVARSLMAWGVKQLTLVDNGRVSYSNPARQCLFDFQDCQQGRYKAIAASDQLQRIYPGMQTAWQLLSIPMPGHPYTTSTSATDTSSGANAAAPSSSVEMAAAQAQAEQQLSAAGADASGTKHQIEPRVLLDEEARARLDSLVQTHDVIFLLTDSREARWLPTMLAQTHHKLAINAALGFDSYLVMHQGISVSDTATGTSAGTGTSSAAAENETADRGVDTSPPDSAAADSNGEVRSGGCYFCSDIVAAANSQKDRTLDEQCTVTRPGLALIAGALCGEMLVAIVHEAAQRAERVRKQEQRRLRQLTKQQQQRQQQTAAATVVDQVVAQVDADVDEYHLGGALQRGGKEEEEEDEEILAAQYSVEVVPHQVRGSVLGFSQMLLECPAFPLCTACSTPITTAYRGDPASFVQGVCAQPQILEEVSGVAEMVSQVDVHLCIDSDDDF